MVLNRRVSEQQPDAAHSRVREQHTVAPPRFGELLLNCVLSASHAQLQTLEVVRCPGLFANRYRRTHSTSAALKPSCSRPDGTTTRQPHHHGHTTRTRWPNHRHDTGTPRLATDGEQPRVQALLHLSRRLEDVTRRNIELSTANLSGLQHLQMSNTPLLSDRSLAAAAQPPRLVHAASKVLASERGRRAADASAARLPSSRAARGSSELHRVPSDGRSALEQAASIMIQMSRCLMEEPDEGEQ